MNRDLMLATISSVVVLAILVPVQSFSVSSYGSFVTYVDQSNGLTMEYPENWKKIEDVEGLIKMVSFVSPSDGVSDDFFENIGIFAGPSYDYTLEDSLDGFIDGFSPGIPNFMIIETENMMISGFPAYKVRYNDSAGKDTSSIMGEFLILISNKQIIVVNFIAESTYPDYEPSSQKIFDSVQIDSSLVPKVLTGKYSNSDFGVEVELPNGWINVESLIKAKEQGVGQMTAVMSIDPTYVQSKNTEDFVVMGIFLSKIDQIGFDKVLSNMDEADCQPSSNEAKIVEVNKMKALEFEMICDNPDLGQSINAIAHTFMTQKNIVYTIYGAGSESTYTKGLENFKNYENSVKIKNTLDLSDPYSVNGIFGVKIVKNSVKAGADSYDVIVGSDSAITNFSFNQDAQEISFKVSGKPYAMGTAGIYPGNLLNPPYKVTVDGQVVDNVTMVHDTTNGVDSLSFSYKYPVNMIIVSGQQNPKLTSDGGLTTQIPGWIKNNAKWWSENSIGDEDFTKGIQFLIKEKIMKIPKTETSGVKTDQKIPNWIKNNAKWWSEDQISDGDFLKGIQYLVENGIIAV